jgi:hypothetical protein
MKQDKKKKDKKYQLTIGEIDESTKIFDSFNPLRVENQIIAEFIFLKDVRDMITTMINQKKKEAQN